MGLDMYLRKVTYIASEYEHREVKGTVEITIKGKPIPIKFNRIHEISESVGYWRKANAIHRWFVQNCQDGEDDCREAQVSKEQLLKLLADCKAVKEDKRLSETLLPPQSGFFFGSTELDEGYFEDIDDTIKIIEDLVAEDTENKQYFPFDVIYRSSW